jgi:endo-1,4-beta-xylanase
MKMPRVRLPKAWIAITGALALAVGAQASAAPGASAPTALAPSAPAPVVAKAGSPVALKDAFQGIFRIGVAMNQDQFSGKNAAEAALIAQQFNAISPENALKWDTVHPRDGQYNFAPADQYVDFGVKNNMFIVGHNLVWHSQVPAWVFQNAAGGALDKDALLARMKDHIMTVVGRYKGRIKGWDVVNEAIDDNGGLRHSRWYDIIGPEYLVKAFQYAHEADPAAGLYYNDYSLENPQKRETAVQLVKYLQGQGVPITGIGLQGHYKLDADTPSTQAIDETIQTFADLGVKVMITELDVDVLPGRAGADVNQRQTGQGTNPYPNGLPDAVQQALAKRYADIFAVYLKHRATITRVTFWGLNDGQTWLNDFPFRGRANYPLLFDRQNQPKPAFDAVVNLVKSAAVK